jgi:hypothetical protein
MALQEQASLVAELESERAALKEQLAELSFRLESIETQGDPSSSLAQRRLELRTKELESRLDLEQTTRARMEVCCYYLSSSFSSSITFVVYRLMAEKFPIYFIFPQSFIFYFLPAVFFLLDVCYERVKIWPGLFIFPDSKSRAIDSLLYGNKLWYVSYPQQK